MLSAGPPNLKPSGHKLVAIKPWIEKKSGWQAHDHLRQIKQHMSQRSSNFKSYQVHQNLNTYIIHISSSYIKFIIWA